MATIYVYLLNESVDVWRPVDAEYLGNDRYRIVSVNPHIEDEEWQFGTGEVVLCSPRNLAGGSALVAYAADARSA